MRALATRHERRGSVVVPVAASLVVLAGIAALVVDIGRIYTARSELQACTDAAALAGANVLLNEGRLKGLTELNQVLAAARATAADFALRNQVMGQGPSMDLNSSNAADGDIVIGYLNDPTNLNAPLDFSDPFRFNTVQLLVHQDETRNGSIAMTFARVLGFNSKSIRGRAAATFQDGIVGFNVTQSGQNAGLLPFALKRTVWDSLLQSGLNGSNDNYHYDSATSTVTAGSDGIPELNLYPGAGIGQLPPGNFGTVDIGAANNSTADICRQILYGVNETDLSYFGGELRLGADGTLPLNGDTGLSAGFKDELAAIKGQPRTIPLFNSVSGNGNNSYYIVTAFAGVRIMNVKLTGAPSGKQVIVQPAVVVDGSAVSGANGDDYYVYRPVTLSR